MSIGHEIPLTLLSGLPSIPGLLILHCAARSRAIDRKEFGSWGGAILALGGLVLIALPVILWSRLVLHQNPALQHHVSPRELFLFTGYLDVILLWFIWIANAFSISFTPPCSNPWEENWGASYSPELKRRLVGPVFERLEEQGKIGNLIVDVGSGAAPVSRSLPARPGRKFILIDIAARDETSGDTQYLRLDAESVMRPGSLSYRQALLRVCAFLGLDPRSSLPGELATAIIFSDILNYVDFRGVIGGFARFLQNEGRIIIVNLPLRGIREQFSAHGLKNNEDLYQFLQDHRLEIESKDFPCRPRGESDESEEMIVLVARKGG